MNAAPCRTKNSIKVSLPPYSRSLVKQVPTSGIQRIEMTHLFINETRLTPECTHEKATGSIWH